MKQIIYLGKKDDYSEHLRLETEAHLSSVTIKTLEAKTLFEAYAFTLNQQPQVVVMDLSFFRKFSQVYAEQIRKVIPHQVHFIVVYPSKEEAIELGRLTSLGDFIYCIRNFNVEDIVNFFRNIILKKPQTDKIPRKAFFQDQINAYQCMRVRFLARTYAQVETHRCFENNSLIPVDFPYFPQLFHSQHHKFNQRSSSDIHSHYRYSYQMEYQYLSPTPSVEERHKLLNNFQYELNGQPITDALYAQIEEVLKERKSLVLAADKKTETVSSELSQEDQTTLKQIEISAKSLYFNWLLANSSKSYLQKENITVYDAKCNLLQAGTEKLRGEKVSIIQRTIIKKPAEEILKDKPSVIVINFDQDNNVEKIKELIASSTQMRDYFPFVLVFNYQHSPDVLRDRLEYHFVLATSMQPSEDFVIKFLNLYRKKKLEKESVKAAKKFQKLQDQDAKFVLLDETILYDHKVYKDINDLESLFLYSVPLETVWMSEFELMVKTPIILEVGEIFRINKPFDMQLTVIEKAAPDSYRTTIHLVNDADRYSLRAFVDDVLDLTMGNKSPLPPTELPKLKNKHFSKNSSSVF